VFKKGFLYGALELVFVCYGTIEIIVIIIIIFLLFFVVFAHQHKACGRKYYDVWRPHSPVEGPLLLLKEKTVFLGRVC